MKNRYQVSHEFVEFVPDVTSEGVVYISIKYATAVHMCCCGCGNKVVTPFAPRDWRLTYDGEYISLSPSIGNWSFPCQSHYWIRNNRVEWSRHFSKSEVEFVRSGRRMSGTQTNVEGRKSIKSRSRERNWLKRLWVRGS